MAKPSASAANGSKAAPSSSGKKEAILVFTSDLRARLLTDKDDTVAIDALISQVQKHTQAVERLNRKTIDVSGTTSARSRLILRGRVLAFQILHLCQWSSKSTSSVARHLLRLALKVAKFCIDDHDGQTARLVLQRAAGYHSRLHDLSPKEEHDPSQCTELEAEWTVLRIALAWQDDQLDIAEHFFAKIHELLKEARPASAENIVDVLFQIGRSISSKGDFAMAEKWLQRAWGVIKNQQLHEMSRDAVELRIAILQSLVGALMGLETTEGIEEAQNLVRYMESEIGNQPVILLLNLEILTRSPAEAFDSEAYANVLRRMMRTFRGTDSSFKLLVHHISKLHSKTPALGCALLDEFLASLTDNGQSDWIDLVVVNRIHRTVSQRDHAETIEVAEKALSRLDKPIGSDASLAVYMLIWKKIESNYSQGQYDLADGWCRLALCPALASAGPLNIGKLQRKLVLCAIARNDLDSARSIYYSMSEGAQKDPNTQYLMYKTAVRSGDREMAAECLEVIAQASPKQLAFLYACVTDGHRTGDKLIAVDALKKLVDVCDVERPGEVHLPALLRCIIMLLNAIIESGEERDSLLVDLCSIFDAVASAAQKAPKDEQGNKIFDARELEWFCQNSYNLGLKHASDWDFCRVVQILTACVNIIGQFPDDIPEEMAADLSLRSIFCNFLISSALVSLARSQDNLEEQLQKYLILRKYIAEADSEVQKRLESKSLDEVSSTDLVGKLALLLAFDFEAAVALKQWHQLGEIVLKASGCRNLEAFKMMADCILRAHAPREELFSILRKIINEISALDESDPARLAKYARCLFQTIVASNSELGGRLLDEACSMASEAYETPSAWPTEEVEWFASAAYNHSIDLWGREDDEACRWWAQRAMKMAHCCGDGGQLEEILQAKYVNLKLDFDDTKEGRMA